MNDPSAIEIYTIYDHPRDFPDEYVARLSTVVAVEGRAIQHDGGIVARGVTLQEVRNALPPFLCRLPRDPGDDLCIVETWV